MTNNKLLESALYYHSKGWSIIPINPKTKSTFLFKWAEYQDRLSTEEEITDWWTKWSNAAIGVVTGEICGFDVVDVDPRHGGTTDGLTPTVHSKTGGGGWHFFYKHTPGLHGRNGLRPGVDFKTTGGYVILPPSSHKSGNFYEWIVSSDQADFAELPEWIKEEFKSESQEVTLKESINVPEGDRHNKLLSLSNSLLSRKYAPNEVWLALSEINKTYQKPLEPDELTQIFLDACRFIGNQQSDELQIPIVIPNALEFSNQDFGEAEWLIDNLMPIGGSGILVAKRESYKTWLGLYISHCVCKGLQLWEQFSTVQTNVLYIANDDPAASFKKRLSQFAFDDNFFIYHQALPSFSVDQENGSFEGVKKLINEKSIGLVLVDILRNTHDKDSNVDKEAKAVLEKYKELRENNPKLVLIFIIHPSKENAFEKRLGKRQSEEAVGSYYWEAAVDTVISLSKSTDEEGTDSVVITVTKDKQSEQKPKPFVGIKRMFGSPIEFIYEEKIPEKLKLEEARDAILLVLQDKPNLKRVEIIDFLVENSICSKRTAESAISGLTKDEKITHSKSTPYIYNLVSSNSDDGVAELPNNQLNQQQLSYVEEVENEI